MAEDYRKQSAGWEACPGLFGSFRCGARAWGEGGEARSTTLNANSLRGDRDLVGSGMLTFTV